MRLTGSYELQKFTSLFPNYVFSKATGQLSCSPTRSFIEASESRKCTKLEMPTTIAQM